MRILSLHTKNFMSIGDIELKLNSAGLNLVLGHNVDDKRFDSNGAAKSALFESLVWCLYGQLMRPLTQDDIIRLGTSSVNVLVYLDPEDGTEPIIIQRKRIKGKGTEVAVTTKSGVCLFPANSVKDIQPQIDSWLGLDFRTFTNSVYFGRGLVKFFMSASDAERKELLETILQLVSFDDALDNAKATAKTALEDVVTADKAIAINEALITEKKSTLTFYESSFKSVKKQRETELPELKRLLEENLKNREVKNTLASNISTEINDITKEYSKKIEDLEKSLLDKGKVIKKNTLNKIAEEEGWLTHKIEEVSESYKNLIHLEENEKDLLTEKSKAVAAVYMTKFGEYSRIKADIANIGKQIEKTQSLGVFCNSCGQGISSIYKDEVIKKFVEEVLILKMAEMDKEKDLEELNQENKDFTSKISLSSKCIEAHNQKLNVVINEVKEEYGRKLAAINQEETKYVLEEAEEANKLKKLWDKENKELLEEKWRLSYAFVEEIGIMNLAIQQMESSIKAIETAYENCLKNVQSLVDDIKKFEKSIEMTEIEKKKALKTKDLADFWIEGFGAKGIKSFIFESALPYLTERANKYSTYLTGGTVVIDILPTTMVKSTGNAKEKLFIQAKNKLGANVYDGNSDGERRRIDICVLLALQDLISTRATKVWNTLIFDEVMDALDKTGTEHVIDLFRTFSGKSIYIISHSSDLKQHFDTAITITKEKGVSSV
jgi:DNA repair exonuclease SbcCD ATPase subunit